MQDMGLGAGLAAIGFWGFIAAVVLAGIWYDIRKREMQQETLRRVIESGQPVEPSLVDKLTPGADRLDRDLRVGGLITLSVAPGLALLAWFIGQISSSALYPILGAAALVACVGIGLLAASKAVGRSGDDR